jgi:hypothetical protein
MCVKFAGVGSSNVLQFVGPPEKRNARAYVSEKINLQFVCVGQSEREIICVQKICSLCVCVGPLGKQKYVCVCVCVCVWRRSWRG